MSVRRLIAAAAALSLCFVLAPPDAARAGIAYRACELSPGQQLPPGGTPAYNLTVQRRGVSCRDAVAVMRAFHRCRTRTGTTCDRRLVGGWRCNGRSDRADPTMYGSFGCAASGARRVRGTYWQEKRFCFGAAARDPALPCRNDARVGFPRPGRGDPDRSWDWSPPAPSDRPAGQVALIGDSHTHHWSGAMSIVLAANRWAGHKLAQPGCFFNEEVWGFSESCMDWYRGVQGWLAAHPEVHTIFVTATADSPVFVPTGRTYEQVKTDGFRRAFQAVPASVKHIVVLRDTTRSTTESLACIDAAMARRTQRLAPLCGLPRGEALRTDLSVAAVKSLDDPRYSSVDLSRYMCGATDCHPVVGGVRVNVDIWGHLFMSFTRTLGPYLLREVRKLEASW